MSAAPLPEANSDPPTTPPRQFLSLAGHPVATVGNERSTAGPAVPPNIADPYRDLLAFLDPPRRRGMISWIATGYYDGWRPDRAEIADLVGVELGVLRIEESIDRRHRRNSGFYVPDIFPRIRSRIANRDADPICTPARPTADTAVVGPTGAE